MNSRSRTASAWLAILALLMWMTPHTVLADSTGARLEGLVLDLDGRPAAGYAVHLVDEHGQATARSTTDDDGRYTFPEVRSGSYSLGVENLDGQVAPVAGPPLRVAGGELARRDVKLMRADAAMRDAALESSGGLGLWWGSLSLPAKAWVVIGGLVAVGLTAAALDDDEDRGSPDGVE